MDIMRVAIVVIVAYILGLATGLVGGVVFSFREFGAPAPVERAIAEASPIPRATATANGIPQVARTDTGTPGIFASNNPSSSPEGSPASTVLATQSTEPTNAGSGSPSLPQGAGTHTPTPTPSISDSETPVHKQTESTLVITANKGRGFVVFIDGRKAGVTPLSLNVAPDVPHSVKVGGGEKFKSWQGQARAAAGEKRTVEAILVYVPPALPAATAPQRATYYPPAPVYAPPAGGSGGGRPGVTGRTRW